MKRISLKRIAVYVNENMPGYIAEVVESFCDTDRPCGNLRIPGEGRYSNRLIIRKGDKVIVDHNSAETYRNNREVLDWLEDGHYRGRFEGDSYYGKERMQREWQVNHKQRLIELLSK